jgi:hypothetical protein
MQTKQNKKRQIDGSADKMEIPVESETSGVPS